MSALVIAEAASAHDRNFEKATRLIDAAVQAGADCCKFQFWSNPDRLADRRQVPPFYREFYRRYAVPVSWLSELHAYCGDRIEFMCTVFLPEDVVLLSPYVKRWKISSFEAESMDLFEAIEAEDVQRPRIISTGMWETPDWSAFGPEDSVLHCVSSYPAPLEAVNLRAIRGGEVIYDGYSDHTGDIHAGAFAVCAGAAIVEVHMKLDDTDPHNPDAGSFALLPEELYDYVGLIRKAEQMLGTSTRAVQACERPMLAYKVGSR